MRYPWTRRKSDPAGKPEPSPSTDSGSAESNPRATRADAFQAAGRAFRLEDWVSRNESENERTVRAGFVGAAKRHLARLPMGEDVVALYFSLLDARTPFWVKGVAAAALAYFVLPLDALPDVLPLVGLSDDVAVLSTALATVSAYITSEHRDKARKWLSHERIIDVTPSPAS